MYPLTFILAMLTPVCLFSVGLYWKLSPPKGSSQFLSYRTALSMRSAETWTFAHQNISKLWIRIGLILSVVTAVVMVVFRAQYTSFVLWLIGGQMAFLCVTVFLVDTALKVSFDEAGKRL